MPTELPQCHIAIASHHIANVLASIDAPDAIEYAEKNALRPRFDQPFKDL
jgi:hypothetical protein